MTDQRKRFSMRRAACKHKRLLPREYATLTKTLEPVLTPHGLLTLRETGEALALKPRFLREFHWLSLLSGPRRNDLATLRWTDVSMHERTMTLRAPKGATLQSNDKVPFVAPASLVVYCTTDSLTEWVFLAASRSGHVEEIRGSSWVNGKNGDKRKIVRLTKAGHSLRHSYHPSMPLQGQQHPLAAVSDESALLPFADVVPLCGECRNGPMYGRCPRCKRNLTFLRSVRVQPCIRPVGHFALGSAS